jgi:hypothetical protein
MTKVAIENATEVRSVQRIFVQSLLLWAVDVVEKWNYCLKLTQNGWHSMNVAECAIGNTCGTYHLTLFGVRKGLEMTNNELNITPEEKCQ